jgi:hypothetical protein
MHMRQTVTAVVTGKPINIGGSRGRREATGRGVLIVCEQAIKKLGLNRESSRVIVQGFGNVGSNAARLMAAAGYKIIGIDEVGGGLYNKNGIDVEALWEYRQKNGMIQGFPGAEKSAAGGLITEDCEILIPCGNRESDHQPERGPREVQDLAEGANGPTTAAADEVLADKGVFVIPTFLPTPAARHHLLLRVGAGPAGLFLEGIAGKRATRGNHGIGIRRCGALRGNPSRTQPHCRRTCWRSIGWRTPSSSAEFTRRQEH